MFYFLWYYISSYRGVSYPCVCIYSWLNILYVLYSKILYVTICMKLLCMCIVIFNDVLCLIFSIFKCIVNYNKWVCRYIYIIRVRGYSVMVSCTNWVKGGFRKKLFLMTKSIFSWWSRRGVILEMRCSPKIKLLWGYLKYHKIYFVSM